jgi:hypothetical protein
MLSRDEKRREEKRKEETIEEKKEKKRKKENNCQVFLIRTRQSPFFTECNTRQNIEMSIVNFFPNDFHSALGYGFVCRMQSKIHLSNFWTIGKHDDSGSRQRTSYPRLAVSRLFSGQVMARRRGEHHGLAISGLG